MKYHILIFTYLLSSCSANTPPSEPAPNSLPSQTTTQVGEAASVNLSPSSAGFWRADFSWVSPTTRLDFVRSSKKRRPERLKLLDDDFEIVSANSLDSIRRKDGAAFNAVSVLEPTSIENPPAGYLPFAQFGDGGLLLYTGRFHTCAGICPLDNNNDEGPWRITISPGASERMIINGAVANGPTSFVDGGDGTKVYIGNSRIVQAPGMLAVIDAALPNSVSNGLDQLFPPLMAYFGERLGALNQAQMLFASYNVPGDLAGSSIKGGTLPQQVFMHFEGAQIPDFSSENDFSYWLAWFFAHESAHLHQRYRTAPYEENDSWLHEGSAEAFAYLALRDLGFVTDTYLEQRLTGAKKACATALEGGSLHDVLNRDGPFQAFYDCGLILHLAVDAASRDSSNSDLFVTWKAFIQRVAEGAPWNTATYLDTIKEKANEEIANVVEAVVTEHLDAPLSVLDRGLARSGFRHATPGPKASQLQ